ncbi:1-acyl-sn-glycerol-3-phosphate acyltransferase epsilon-like [Haliotis rubra]|uniref:1-acyl-sn-glycerol-3-phosphate acyltransferase epsilon-like n=1 Tax=Haliotis rubra TaxID=36100 RepID=UPI001EE6158B|nr:1-acyl-sn-glycerol-3-phosphate acyltransferase epsilon-like [Haliotis rubra]
MLLSLLVYLQSLRWVVPTAVMLGSAPAYITAWMAVRMATAILPRRYYRRGDDLLYSAYQRLVLFFFENYTGVEIYLYGDTDVLTSKQENVLYMSNHQCTVDWVVCDMLAIRQGMLGTLRYVLKDGLRFFPLYGFYLAQHDCLYVKRSGKFDKDRASRQLERLQRDKTPTWFVVFPEGTRFNPELPDVIKKSQEFAKAQGYPVLHHVLTPRYRALQVGLLQMRTCLDAVYDITIAYGNTVAKETGERLSSPGMPEFLQGGSKQLHLHISRIPLSEVPDKEEKLSQWVQQRFQEKEKLLSHFYSTNNSCSEPRQCFPGKRVVSSLPLSSTAPAFIFWGGLFTAVLATSEGRALYWKVALGSTAAGCLWMAARS